VHPRQGGRPRPHGVGQQQLAAGRGVQLVDGVQGPLVGHRERTDLAHLVAPELDPQRVLGSGREHVHDAATDGELAATLDHVHPGVSQPGELGHHRLEGHLVADPQPHRPQLAKAGGHRLHQAAHGRHHHGQRPVLLRVGQPAQHGQPPAHRVRARRQPLVRQRLPGREHRDPLRPDQVADGRGQHLGLATGGGHREHRTTCGGGQRRDHHRPGRRRALQLQQR
jgi:hypothetical protein